MPENTPQIFPYCSLEWADAYLKANLWNDAWISATQEKQRAALNTASDIIYRFVEFFDEYGNTVDFPIDKEQGNDIPAALKEATALEAKYLLTLDESILEPNTNLTMGIRSANGVVFDKELQGELLIAPVITRIVRMGGIIDTAAMSNSNGFIVSGRYQR